MYIWYWFDLNIEISCSLIRKIIPKSIKIGDKWSKCKDLYMYIWYFRENSREIFIKLLEISS